MVYKGNDLNKASFQNFALNHYQVFLHLISKIEGYANYNVFELSAEKRYTLCAKEFMEIFNVDIKSCYRVLKTSVDKLLNTKIIIAREKSVGQYKINICAAANYIETEGRIEVEFTKQIMSRLWQVKEKFTKYNLKEISRFKSIYSTRLYELIAQHKKNGWLIISVDELRRVFAVNNKLRKYFDFKLKTFAYACKEINKNHNLNLRFFEIKDGRKIVKIRFNFDVVKSIDPGNKKA